MPGINICNVLHSHVTETPKAPALSDSSTSFNYSELETKAKSIAEELRSCGLHISEPVGILLPVCIDQVLCQFAVIEGQGVCFPINIQTHGHRLENLIERAQLRFLISCESHEGFEAVSRQPLGKTDNDKPILLYKYSQSRTSKKVNDEASHLLHTSGSTGEPKIVQIAEKAIMHLASLAEVSPLRPSDKCLFVNDPSFDLALFEVWVTLLSGAEVVVGDRDTLLDGRRLKDFLNRKGVTVAFLSTGHFNLIADDFPTSFSQLRILIIAGSAASPQLMRKVLDSDAPPKTLWNAYGPTEATSFATIHPVDREEAQRPSIAIGKAIGDMKVKLIGEDGQLASTGEVGEIYLGGPGLMLGYLDDMDENEKKLVSVEEEPLLYYKTGDLGRIRNDSQGVIEFVGRKDRQIKHNGFRVELQEVENVIRQNSQVKDAYALQLDNPSGGLQKILVACVVPHDTNKFDPRPIRDFCYQHIPEYMVPTLFVPLNEFPLNARGKVDRPGVTEKVKEWQKRNSSSENKDQASGRLEMIWEAVLGVPTFEPDADFFHLGASSLQAAKLTVKLKESLGKTVSLKEVYEHSRFQDMARFLEASGDSADKENPNHEDLVARMKADAILADTFKPQSGSVQGWDHAGGSILITGATGFVGVFFLHHLLTAQPTKARILCLVRSNKEASSESRLQEALEQYDLWDPKFQGRFQVVDGNFSREDFGLSPDEYAQLADSIDAVFHFGAHVNFCQRYDEHFEANITGTMNVIRFAGTGRPKGIHYASTIDAWGATGLVNGVKSLLEDEPLEPHIQGPIHDTGYSQSQWVAEEQVRRARDRGFSVAIYRLGTVICDSRNHVGNPKDFFARVMVGCAKLGYFPLIEDLRWEYVPIDYACQAIAHIAKSIANLGRSYSIVSPDHSKSVSLEETCRLLNEAGYPAEKVEYAEWVKALDTSSTLSESPLLALMPLVQEKVLDDFTRFQTSKNTPVYQTDNTLDALGDSQEFPYTPLNVSAIRGMFEFWKRKGIYDI